MSRRDEQFVNNVHAAVELSVSRASRLVLGSLTLLLICAIAWAAWAQVEEVTRGDGRVIPSQQIQVVQSLEGGIVDTLLVQEGATVRQGDTLMRIDATKFASEAGEVRERRIALTESLRLLDREIELTRRLHEQKVVPEIEMLRLQRQASELRGQLAMLSENIKSAEDRVRRTELKSPVYGIINKLNVTTLGAVVQPGAPLVEIVPLDDTLLVESRIRPQDVAFLRPGQEAIVKITAYDYSIFGSLPGKVERISADTLTNQKNETFYRVIVRTDKSFLGSVDKPLPIIPGMVATVDILTGEKSVLDYLLKPIMKARYEALRER